MAKVVSHVHVNEMAEQKIDRSDLTAVTWISCFAAAVSFFLAAKAASCLALALGGIASLKSVLEAPRGGLSIVSPGGQRTQGAAHLTVEVLTGALY